VVSAKDDEVEVKSIEFARGNADWVLFKVAGFRTGDATFRIGKFRPSLSELSLKWDKSSG
jgi:hypothetical protein